MFSLQHTLRLRTPYFRAPLIARMSRCSPPSNLTKRNSAERSRILHNTISSRATPREPSKIRKICEPRQLKSAHSFCVSPHRRKTSGGRTSPSCDLTTLESARAYMSPSYLPAIMDNVSAETRFDSDSATMNDESNKKYSSCDTFIDQESSNLSTDQTRSNKTHTLTDMLGSASCFDSDSASVVERGLLQSLLKSLNFVMNSGQMVGYSSIMDSLVRNLMNEL